MKSGIRPIQDLDNPDLVSSCSDSRVIFIRMNELSKMWIKSEEFTLEKLLDSRYESIGNLYINGDIAIHRLTPYVFLLDLTIGLPSFSLASYWHIGKSYFYKQ